jgi:hypothetical protein
MKAFQTPTQVRAWRGRKTTKHSTIAIFHVEDLQQDVRTPGDVILDNYFGDRDAVARGRAYR